MRAEQRSLPEATFGACPAAWNPAPLRSCLRCAGMAGEEVLFGAFFDTLKPVHKLVNVLRLGVAPAGQFCRPTIRQSIFVHSFALSTISQLAGATCSRTSHCETFLGSARCAHWPSSNRQVDGHVSPLAHGDIEDQTLVLLEFGYS